MIFRFFLIFFLFVSFSFSQTNKISSSNINDIKNLATIPRVKVYFSLQKNIKKKIDKVTIADEFYFVLEVKADKKYRVVPPNLKSKLSDVEITDYQIETETEKRFFYYKLTSYQVGKLEIPPMKIELVDRKNVLVLKTQNISIEILSVLSESERVDNEIKGIRNIIDFNILSESFWFIIAIIILVIIIIAIGVFLLIKKLRQKKPYYILILRDLEVMIKKDWFKKKEYKKYYYSFSKLVVDYLVNEKVILSSMSSREIIKSIERKKYTNKTFYSNFFEEAEGVKFANQTPNQENTKKLINQFKEILNQKILEAKNK